MPMIKMRALKDANESAVGEPVAKGKTFEVNSAVALDLEKRGVAERVEGKASRAAAEGEDTMTGGDGEDAGADADEGSADQKPARKPTGGGRSPRR